MTLKTRGDAANDSEREKVRREEEEGYHRTSGCTDDIDLSFRRSMFVCAASRVSGHRCQDPARDAPQQHEQRKQHETTTAKQ
ncbi:hypothetical protein NHX12_023817 [Muraenolepis orangiensis]|uniref:Uncharacterized protein n=1 Tax=Muraenolepis orangiensis TaxID=630683 RepID=A0A9Q0ISG0_9TELE|nr:hypothetical protein NHX12_023817 [Muraenolepis orangiensis]